MYASKPLMLKEMRIEVGKIKKGPLTLEEDIEASLWELDSPDVKFIDNIHITCEFSLAGHEILARGSVTTQQLITCSRCLEDSSNLSEQEFTLSYSLGSLGDYVDVDQDIRDEIVLNFPLKFLCNSECKGMCPGCGLNLNIEDCKCKK